MKLISGVLVFSLATINYNLLFSVQPSPTNPHEDTASIFNISTALEKIQQLIATQQHHEAFIACEEAMNKTPAVPDIYVYLAQLYTATNQPLKAIETLQKGICIVSGSKKIHGLLGSLLLKQGQMKEAEAQLLRAHHISPDSFSASQLGDCMMLKKNYASAKEFYEQAFALNKKNSHAAASLGALYAQLGRYEKATEILEEGIQHNQTTAILHYNLGCVLSSRGNKTGAEMAFRSALACDPHYTNASFKILELLFAEKNLDRAYQFFVQIIDNAQRKITVNIE